MAGAAAGCIGAVALLRSASEGCASVIARIIRTVSSFAEPETMVDYARTRWEEGEQRLRRVATDSRRRDVLERVVDALMDELEKQVGQVFTTLELAAIQDRAEPWCTRIAHDVAPDAPYAWDLDVVQNAAFHRYARRASDYQLLLT